MDGTSSSSQLKEYLSKQPVVAVYLHGSKVKGYSLSESDTDIAVVVDDKKKVDRLQLMQEVSQRLRVDKPDVRVMDRDSSPLFLFSIIKDGRLIYERSRDERVAFESFVMKNYYYTDRIRRIYRMYL